MKKKVFLNRRDFIDIGVKSLSFMALAPVIATVSGCSKSEEKPIPAPTESLVCSFDEGLLVGEEFSIVYMTDTHADMMCSFENLGIMAQWIVENKDRLNIKYVAHQGDVADNRGSGTLQQMLVRSRQALQPITDHGIPFSVAIGNHDYDISSRSRYCSEFNRADAFGLDFYKDQEYFGGTFENEVSAAGLDPGGTINHYFRRHIGGQDFLFLCLELYPRDKVLEWCDNLVMRFPESQVIVVTHSYLDQNAVLQKSAGYPEFSRETGSPEFSNGGDEMWNKHFRKWKKLRLITGGHFIHTPRQNYMKQKGGHGNIVHSHFWNYQGFGYSQGQLFQPIKPGGENQAAMLKIFRFKPNSNAVHIENYMPSAHAEAESAQPKIYAFMERCLKV